MNWPPNRRPLTSELGLNEKSEVCFAVWSLGCWCFCFLFLIFWSFSAMAMDGGRREREKDGVLVDGDGFCLVVIVLKPIPDF